MFNNICELQTYLKKTTDLNAVSNYLRMCIAAEAKELYKMDKKQNKSAANKEQCTKDAEEHYLEEINYFLENEVKPSAMTVMGYRRKPHAWAIADYIKEYKHGQLESSKIDNDNLTESN